MPVALVTKPPLGCFTYGAAGGALQRDLGADETARQEGRGNLTEIAGQVSTTRGCANGPGTACRMVAGRPAGENGKVEIGPRIKKRVLRRVPAWLRIRARQSDVPISLAGNYLMPTFAKASLAIAALTGK